MFVMLLCVRQFRMSYAANTTCLNPKACRKRLDRQFNSIACNHRVAIRILTISQLLPADRVDSYGPRARNRALWAWLIASEKVMKRQPALFAISQDVFYIAFLVHNPIEVGIAPAT